MLLILARFGLAGVLALALLALAVYAAGARMKQWLITDRFQAERSHRL